MIKYPCEYFGFRKEQRAALCGRKRAPWVLAATIIGSGMAFIDSTVVNVALPALQADLHATVIDVQWVIAAYALFLSALLLVGGALGDQFGRRRVYAIGLVLFMSASVWCGLAPTVTQLIIARAAQGVGGALLVPGSLAIITVSFSEGERAKAIGTWSGFSAMTTALGPLLGGWLIDHASWRWVFYINIPIGLIGLFILFTFVSESRDEKGTAKLDKWGALFAILGLGGIVYGLIESPILGFGHPLVIGAISGGVIALIAFLYVEKYASAPMMPLTLFHSRSFSGANILTFFLYAALGGVLFFVPFNLIQVQGYSAFAAGAAFLPLIVLIFLLSRWAGTLVDRYGAKRPLIVGSGIATIGFALLAVPDMDTSYWTGFFPAFVILGFGLAVTVTPLTTLVMGAVEESRAGIASGINNAISRTAGLLAIAVFGIFALNSFNRGLDVRLTEINVPPKVVQALDEQRFRLAAAEIPVNIDKQQRTALRNAIDESFIDSFRLLMIIATALAFISWITAILTIEGQQSKARTQLM